MFQRTWQLMEMRKEDGCEKVGRIKDKVVSATMIESIRS